MRVTHQPADGAVVQVKDHRQRLLGSGFFNSKSKINVRMLGPDRVTADEAFFRGRIEAALALRRQAMPQASSFRVVNAESDFLSGLVVDKYEDVLVVQTSSLAMDQRLELITEILKSLFQPRAIIERNDLGSRKFEGLGERLGVLHGEASAREPVMVKINQLEFEVNLLGGHKTGMYLDQQINYGLVGNLAREARVLDCFSFHGGFALHAAKGGATQVLALDQSEEALVVAGKNAARNGLKIDFEAVNVFDWLKAQTSTGPHEKVIPRFDLIILDPPSFTRTRAAIPEAIRGYKEIHLRALKLIRKGGSLVTFCCSHHVTSEIFMDAIRAAALDAHRILRRTAIYSQAPDHPVIPSIPETEYLKGFAFQVV